MCTVHYGRVNSRDATCALGALSNLRICRVSVIEVIIKSTCSGEGAVHVSTYEAYKDMGGRAYPLKYFSLREMKRPSHLDPPCLFATMVQLKIKTVTGAEFFVEQLPVLDVCERAHATDHETEGVIAEQGALDEKLVPAPARPRMHTEYKTGLSCDTRSR